MDKKPLVKIALSIFLEVIRTIAIIVVLAFVIRYFLIQPFIVEGNSMEPNFHNKQFILINKITYRFSKPKRGDVIVFHSTANPREYFIKRIIGLPNETLKITDGKIYINNSLLKESYLSDDESTYIETNRDTPYEITIGTNNYFVLGDNRDESSDSRSWGPLSKSNIVGKFWLVIYPSAAKDQTSFNPVVLPSI